MLKDLKLHINGYDDTYVDLTQAVDEKLSLAQQCLVVVATKPGSDKLYPDKGSDILYGTIGVANVVSRNYIGHACNFAALDTRVFVEQQLQDFQEILDVQFYNEETNTTADVIKINDVKLSIKDYEHFQRKLKLNQSVEFSDLTSTDNMILSNI